MTRRNQSKYPWRARVSFSKSNEPHFAIRFKKLLIIQHLSFGRQIVPFTKISRISWEEEGGGGGEKWNLRQLRSKGVFTNRKIIFAFADARKSKNGPRTKSKKATFLILHDSYINLCISRQWLSCKSARVHFL